MNEEHLYRLHEHQEDLPYEEEEEEADSYTDVSSSAGIHVDVSAEMQHFNAVSQRIVEDLEQYKRPGDGRSAPPPTCYKVLVVGNSGRGKSLICNMLVGDNVFVHKMQIKSVTSEVEFKSVALPNKAEERDGMGPSGVVVVFNLPGLIEADENNLVRNQNAIEIATRVLPDAPTIVIFVCRDTNGRLCDEDEVAIKTFISFADGLLQPEATILLNNAVDESEYDDLAQWEQDVTGHLVSSLSGKLLPENVHFVPKLKPLERANVTVGRGSTVGQRLRRMLHNLLLSFPGPRPLCPPQGKHLVLESIAMKEASLAAKRELENKRREQEEREEALRREAEAFALTQQQRENELKRFRQHCFVPDAGYEDAGGRDRQHGHTRTPDFERNYNQIYSGVVTAPPRTPPPFENDLSSAHPHHQAYALSTGGEGMQQQQPRTDRTSSHVPPSIPATYAPAKDRFESRCADQQHYVGAQQGQQGSVSTVDQQMNRMEAELKAMVAEEKRRAKMKKRTKQRREDDDACVVS